MHPDKTGLQKYNYYFLFQKEFSELKQMFYQLAFVTPGIFPALAISRNVTLEIPNFLMYPLGLPVILHLLCNLTLEELRGSLSSPTQSPASLSALRFSAKRATNLSLFLSRALIASLAIS